MRTITALSLAFRTVNRIKSTITQPHWSLRTSSCRGRQCARDRNLLRHFQHKNYGPYPVSVWKKRCRDARRHFQIGIEFLQVFLSSRMNIHSGKHFFLKITTSAAEDVPRPPSTEKSLPVASEALPARTRVQK